VVQQLIKFKRVRRPYVGLAFRLVNVETGQTDPTTGRPTRALGMYILEVKSGSPAEKGGLQEGDVVVEIDGAPVRGLGDITDRIGLEPEKTFRVKVVRPGGEGGGKALVLSVTSVADERIY
jgi:serine protease Do